MASTRELNISTFKKLLEGYGFILSLRQGGETQLLFEVVDDYFIPWYVEGAVNGINRQ